MPSMKPYEMTFTEFAETIEPSWLIVLTRFLKKELPYPEWLTSVSRHTENRVTYMVSWRNLELRKTLPPHAHNYNFNDVELHKFTEALGLNSEFKEDNIKASELLATRNAWIASIQDLYAGYSPCALIPEIAAEYVLLTSGLNHPWIREQIRLHKLKEVEPAPSNQPDLSCRQYQAHLQLDIEEKERDINHWIEEFEFDRKRWTSIYESDAWYAQKDINEALKKIRALEDEIGNQKDVISKSEIVIEEFKAHKVSTKKMGRPKISSDRHGIAKKFTSQWVKSLMRTLEIDSCAKLAEFVAGSNQMSWGRWQKEKAAPPYNHLLTFGYAEITDGKYSGKQLQDVPTRPSFDDLKSLIRLI